MLLVVLLYIPPVQDFAVNKVLHTLNSKGDMQLNVKKFRLSFPVRLTVDSMEMHTPGMEISAARFHTRLEVLPALTGELSLPVVTLNDAVVNIGGPDSTLYMRARLNSASIDRTSVKLLSSQVNIGNLKASGGLINMILSTDTVPAPVTQSEPIDWKISLTRAELDSINYHMEYDPTIMALDCDLPEAILTEGEIDLATSKLNVGTLTINRVDATYITPNAEYLADHPAPEAAANDTVQTMPWTIVARRLAVNDSHAIYATDGAVPSKYFDPSFIEASEINIIVDSFINHGTDIRVPIRKISARENCGISFFLSGLFSMDSTVMHADNMILTTATTAIMLNAAMGMEPENAPVRLKLDAEIGADDIRRLTPAAMQPLVAGLPFQPLMAKADIDGTMNDLSIKRLSAEIPRHIAVSAEGDIADYTDLNKTRGKLDISGNIYDGNFIKTSLFDAKMRRTVNIPAIKLSGKATIAKGVIEGDIRAYTEGGDIALDAMWNNRAEGYDIEAAFNNFPVHAILPTSGVGNLTAAISARGEGLDFFSEKTHADALIDLSSVAYNGKTYKNITLDASVAQGNARVNAKSANPAVNFELDASGNLAGEQLDWTFNGDVRRIDLRAMALSDTTAEGSIALSGTASYIPPVAATRRIPGKPMTVHSAIDITSLTWTMPEQTISGRNINLTFNTDDSLTDATLRNGDLAVDLSSPAPLDTILSHITTATERLDRDIARRRFAIDSMQQALPQFNLHMHAGNGTNILSNFLSAQKMTVGDISLSAANDTILHADARMTRIKSGDTRVDTITLNLLQRGAYMLYDARMNNRPGTFDQFADVTARGYVSASNLSMLLRQQNIKGETGYSIGMMAQMPDTNNITLRIVPYHPIIGYKDWEVNKDNFIEFNLETKHLDANLYLHNNESSLKLFTEHSHENENDSIQEEINLQISDIKLADWIALNPFAPPMTGDLSANMKVNMHLPDINGSGTIALTNFYYDREKVGDFGLDIDLSTNAAGTVRAATTMTVNGVKSITAVGNLNDSTAQNPFMLDFRMIHFPLSVVNPFLPSGTASLSGSLNGVMDITGSMTAPEFNGYVEFDSTTLDVTMLGTPFRFSEVRIPMENNVVTLKDFSIYGANSNPLTINGGVDMTNLSSPRIDLSMTARNMQVVGSQKSRKSQAYGRAFINLDAGVKGNLNFLSIDADLNILSGTNVTYVLPDAVNAITSRSSQDMVRFVNFNDSTDVAEADTIARQGILMNIDAQLTVSTGTTITVELSADGNDKVQLQSNGTLSYTQDFMNDQRFTGRLNIPAGLIRYSLPVIGEKQFNFQEDSYVSFNGNMMNPILNVHAVDNMRANVSVNNNNRVVNFDVGLGVTGTLENMNVAFDLSCPDDITIANELKSMSAEQRANQAMNLLISGIYRSGTTQTISSGNIGTNALFGFLESQLNNWASSAIKGVDISFGINQYDKTVDGANTTAMNYSYQVSKSLFNDRFKIVVGGNYATDAEADENFAQNLISDISFEYLLNRAGTKYVRLFRHTGYESILEGEITQTGVGFVYKKKIRRIGEIFRFLTPKKKKPKVPVTPSAPDPSEAIIPTQVTQNTQTAANDEQKH